MRLWRGGCRRFVAVLASVLLLAGLVAEGAEMPPGSKNFTAPRSVPNYFSNESGPFNGGASARITPPGQAYAAPLPPLRATVAPAERYAHRYTAALRSHGRYHLAARRGGRYRYASQRSRSVHIRQATSSGHTVSHARRSTAAKRIARR